MNIKFFKIILSIAPVIAIFGISIYGSITSTKQFSQYKLIKKYQDLYNDISQYSRTQSRTSNIYTLFNNDLNILWGDVLTINSYNNGVSKYKKNNNILNKNEVQTKLDNAINETPEYANSISLLKHDFFKKLDFNTYASIENFFISSILVFGSLTFYSAFPITYILKNNINYAIDHPAWMFGIIECIRKLKWE